MASFTTYLTNRFELATGQARGSPPPGMGSRRRARYGDGDWKKIDAMAQAEHVTGATIRFWEDVRVGDQPAGVIAEPTTVLDMIRIGGDMVMSMPPLREMPRELGKELSRDEYGVYHNLVEQHFAPVGSDNSIHFMAFGESVMARLVTNWMGDDGWLTRFDANHRSERDRVGKSKLLASRTIVGGHGIGGDAVAARAEVVGKRREGGEHLVDLVVWTESLGGEVWQTASCTVRLMARSSPMQWN